MTCAAGKIRKAKRKVVGKVGKLRKVFCLVTPEHVIDFHMHGGLNLHVHMSANFLHSFLRFSTRADRPLAGLGSCQSPSTVYQSTHPTDTRRVRLGPRVRVLRRGCCAISTDALACHTSSLLQSYSRGSAYLSQNMVL